ncbi:hypothetical protein HYH03_018989, partial [Edaphochlamys debaryana]
PPTTPVTLARRHYGERHPSQLAPLLDLCDALGAAAALEKAAEAGGAAGAGGGEAGPGERRESAAVRRARAAAELLEIGQALAARYQSARDPLSAVLALEAAAGEAAPAVRAAGRGAAPGPARALEAAAGEAQELMYALRPPEARIVMTAKRDGELPKLLRRLGRDCTEELGAYAAGRRNRWLDAWAAGKPLPQLRP